MRHLIAVAALVAAFVFVAPVAFAHSWYDYVCCSDRDCYPLPDDAVLEEQSNGDYLVRWVSPLSGKIIEGRVVKRNVKDTRDGRIHGCERSDGLPRCIYIHRGA